MPGAVVVQCRYLMPGAGTCARDVSLDAKCGGLSVAMLCEGPGNGAAAGCTALPDSAITASCGTELHAYCCGS